MTSPDYFDFDSIATAWQRPMNVCSAICSSRPTVDAMHRLRCSFPPGTVSNTSDFSAISGRRGPVGGEADAKAQFHQFLNCADIAEFDPITKRREHF